MLRLCPQTRALEVTRDLGRAEAVRVLDPWIDLVHGGCCVSCAAPGHSLCRPCFASLPRHARSVRPTPCPVGLATCFAAGEYAGPLGALVVAHKEHAAFALARPLGHLLAVAAGPVSSAVQARGATLVLVPVPSRPGVVRARGHDPMLRISRVAAGLLAASGTRARVVRLLEQRFTVPDQAGLSSAGRATNLAGSMAVRPRARAALAASGAAVSLVICDDVLTTGATAREAQRALEDSGLGVSGIATVAATQRRFSARALPMS